jgi:GNAT superfamily N-acetyltransferase
MDYEFVPYRPDLDAEIVRLQAHLWGDDPGRNAAYLRWKYEDNPYFDEPLLQLARCRGELVGMRGMFGTLWQVDTGGSCHPLPYADDFVILPEHRNRGLAGRILQAGFAEARRRGYSFAVNLSAGPITFVSSLAAGWRSAGLYRQLEHCRPKPAPVRRLEALLPERLRRRIAGVARRLAAGNAFDRLDRAGEEASPVAVERQPRPESMAKLVRRLPWDGRIRHVRDERYLSWRFRNPLHEYRFLFAGEGDLRGYLVLQRYLSRWADPHLVNIVDWEATDDGVRAALLDAALSRGRFGRVQVWSVSASQTVRDLLADRGFEAAERRGVRARSAGLLVRRLDDSPRGSLWRLGSRDPLSIADWDLRMLYSMAG